MAKPFNPDLIADAEPAAYSVSEINALARQALERNFHSVYVVGEMSNLSVQPSGHVYFTLKDAASQISAAMFREYAEALLFKPEAGMEVLAFGDVTLYSRWGQYQIVVKRLEPRGVGALELAFRQLREKLEAEGLFAPERKKPLPWLPERICIVTSAHGEAVHDMLRSIHDRFSRSRVTILPVQVQGPQAAPQIAEAIGRANRMGCFDVIVTGRGGGSLEDLWAFNEEAVARAIAKSRVPVVSAVGHERDVTISDLVADARAMTPTQVGQLVVPDEREIAERLEVARERLTRALRLRARGARDRLEYAWRRPVFARPLAMLEPASRRVEEAGRAMTGGIDGALRRAHERLKFAGMSLEALSPLKVLSRGYSLTRDAEGRVVVDAGSLAEGQTIETILDRGRVESTVSRVFPPEGDGNG